MNNKFLFVPIKLKCLVVNDAARKGQHFERWALNYHNLASYQSPVPAPFSAGTAHDWNNEQEANGVYLHWTLPEALRRGTQQNAPQEGSSTTTKFPLVPNRWLIVRYSGPLNARKATAWVIESDYLDPNQGTSPFLEPFSDKPQITHIGKKVVLEAWKEESTQKHFLTAIGTGDVTFAAYQPYVENVFSMHDPLNDIADQDILSYLVMGWYSNPTNDILANDILATQKALTEKLQSLHWSIIQQDGHANQSIYHGIQ